MKITELTKAVTGQPQLDEIYIQFSKLITELNARDLPDDTVLYINKEIEAINATTKKGSNLKRLLLKGQSKIISLVERELKIVPKNYYRNRWWVIGMAVFGIPIGIALSAGNKNFGSIALGLPIGLAIGLAVGAEKDKKAFREGLQLNVQLNNSIF